MVFNARSRAIYVFINVSYCILYSFEQSFKVYAEIMAQLRNFLDEKTLGRPGADTGFFQEEGRDTKWSNIDNICIYKNPKNTDMFNWAPCIVRKFKLSEKGAPGTGSFP